MLHTLIWKDIRSNRSSLLLAAALMVATYGMAGVSILLDESIASQPFGRRLASILAGGSMMAYGVAQLSLAVLAGNLVAGERTNRSAEFLAYLPPSRGMVLSAKALVLGGWAVVILLVPLVVGSLGVLVSGYPGGSGRLAMIAVSIASFGFCGAGVGWLASCCLQSNALAILFSILAPWVVAYVVMGATWGEASQGLYAAVNLAIGLAGFLFGTRHYLHRMEP
jgi:ABC-type transport system involved in multi-copper enzyme maturation permease subunit